MKSIIAVISALCLSIGVCAAQSGVNSKQVYQQGYTRQSTGTYVQPHMKTEKNTTNHDNFSTKQNVNPYNNEPGSKARDYSSDAQSTYGSRDIQTGSRGGQYYINSNGNKTYVPKTK